MIPKKFTISLLNFWWVVLSKTLLWTLILKTSSRMLWWTWVMIWKSCMSKRATQLLEMEVWEGLLPVSLILLPPSRFLHGDMESDTITEFSSRLSEMAIRLRSQTFGSVKEIHGRLRDRILLTKSGSMVKSQSIETELPREQTGIIVKKW